MKQSSSLLILTAAFLAAIALSGCSRSMNLLVPDQRSQPATSGSAPFITSEGTFEEFSAPGFHGRLIEFPIPGYSQGSTGQITLGPDKDLWFANGEDAVNKIEIKKHAPVFTTFTGFSAPLGITAGLHDNVWFAELGGDAIDRIMPSGMDVKFSASQPLFITENRGLLWYDTLTSVNIYSLDVDGKSTAHLLDLSSADEQLSKMTTGPDGNVWFSVFGAHNYVGQITPTGNIRLFPIAGFPFGLVGGPDGNVWFTAVIANDFSAGNLIGRITPTGALSFFPVPVASFNGQVQEITAGRGDKLYFSIANAPMMGRIDTSGKVEIIPLPNVQWRDDAITTAKDGTIWWVDPNELALGHFRPK